MWKNFGAKNTKVYCEEASAPSRGNYLHTRESGIRGEGQS